MSNWQGLAWEQPMLAFQRARQQVICCNSLPVDGVRGIDW